jgi:hypothetical protein
MTTIETKAGRVEIHCYYDAQAPSNRGWYAEFRRYSPNGLLVEHDDTAKIWSVDMPRRESAEKLAMRLARGYARRMLAAARRAEVV